MGVIDTETLRCWREEQFLHKVETYTKFLDMNVGYFLEIAKVYFCKTRSF